MIPRFLTLVLILTAYLTIPKIHANPKAGFTPRFFAFENGVRFGATEKQIEVLKELGYDSLGSAKPNHLPNRLKLHKEAGLPISSLYIGGKIGTDSLPESITRSIQQLQGHETLIELFVQKGGENTDDEAVAFIRKIADLASASDLRIVLYPHSGFYIDTLDDAVRLATLSERDNVGVMFNLCHFLKVEPKSDLQATLKNAGDLLWRVSINGADIDGSNWGALIQPLDRGSFDQVELMKMLRDLGFSGDVGLQCYAVKGDPKENLKRSIAAWRSILEKSRVE